MKCLTVCQPWPWAIFHLGKNVENRTWPTDHRGPLLIHAGKNRRWFDAEDPDDWQEAFGVRLPAWEDLATGAIVGRVEVVACVRADPALPYYLPGSGPCVWAEGPWLWVLANPVRFPKPVPCRGMRGLFDVPDELIPEEFRAGSPRVG